ncbi:hypothetical protein D3C80_1227570 [compost metagenome]
MPHRQDRLVLMGPFNAVRFAVLLQERIDVAALYAAAGDIGSPVTPQQLRQACLVGVLLAQRCDKGFSGLFRRREGLLRRHQARTRHPRSQQPATGAGTQP